MKEPSTIKGFISIVKKISQMTLFDKKGFDELPIEKQEALLELIGAIENRLPDIEINEKTN
jgi:hypothetical protein